MTSLPAPGVAAAATSPWHRLRSALLNGSAPALPTLCALAGTLLLFVLFLLVQGKPAGEACLLIFQGAFGTLFAWQNTLQRAAPLLLTALCVALPARVGLIVIGGEGALALGGLAAAVMPQLLPALPSLVMLAVMALAAMLAGGLWIALCGGLRQWRGVNETISSLLLSYLAVAVFKHLVEGPLRDPASLNKPSTLPLPDPYLVGSLPGLEVHWGLAWGALACVAAWVFLRHSVSGFAMGVVGGNVRTARLVGLPVNRLILTACALGGAAAGLAGMFEVSAVQGSATSALLAGYGFSGILVAFAARQNPLAIIVCALVIGGVEASGSLLQRRLDLPDATTLVLQGLLFCNLLAWEAITGRLSALKLRWQQQAQVIPAKEAGHA
ncbi:ABC transporter permease [Herbaspirillum huttiense]|jgi:nucleoside ABC transporter membrane protein|uniref:ABC transporter permease n=3 Tax=Herbaspirillum huttiense TaxID=863372 RepID=A0AAJ2H845_9BURK|nr:MULTISPECIES: ABC transporter permease [Herbaspirillum]MBP1315755.1 simple sugar transport system permease protein [Herbaspirillum sp. 1130]MDR6740684.1 simple sugar transport system permease protein [Herbaspirillum sp. 1173]MDR9835345.1 ABC transporter permease [Herbaspirillum huttiense]MDR9848793.1 ABC transporter permease [Herbaspirillum huttiense SE1]